MKNVFTIKDYKEIAMIIADEINSLFEYEGMFIATGYSYYMGPVIAYNTKLMTKEEAIQAIKETCTEYVWLDDEIDDEDFSI